MSEGDERLGVRPRTAYLCSLFAFGTAGVAGGVADYVADGTAWSAVAVLGGGVILGVVGYNAVRPAAYDGPEEWGPLLYLTVAGGVLFALAVGWEFV
jgi:hypothetical protein